MLNTLPRERHDSSEQATPRVDAKALATVRTNRYSVPASLAGLKIAARVGASEITFFHDGKQVARADSNGDVADDEMTRRITAR